MNGMLFAAGLGTRLAPLTDKRPKALVELGGRSLLDRALSHLAAEGVNCIVVNVHHFADMLIEYIDRNRHRWNADIVVSDEREELLDTAGGVAKALSIFANDGPIVLANADVVSNAPVGMLMDQHHRQQWDATLMTGSRSSTRNLLFGDDGLLCGWTNKTSGETRIVRDVPAAYSEAFNAFHIVEQSLVRRFLPVRPLSIITAYLDNAHCCRIGRMPMPDSCYWFDIGTTDKLSNSASWLYSNGQI